MGNKYRDWFHRVKIRTHTRIYPCWLKHCWQNLTYLTGGAFATYLTNRVGRRICYNRYIFAGPGLDMTVHYLKFWRLLISLFWLMGRAGDLEVKARRRREVCLPGNEEDKKVLSSISTCFPRRWKWRPAQRITGVLSPPSFRQQRSHPWLDDWPFHPYWAASSKYLPLPWFSIPSNKKEKNKEPRLWFNRT